MTDNKGVTLIESLVSILLLSTILIGSIGAYYLSISAINRGKHIATVNSILSRYMDMEMQAGYNGGSLGGAYYATMALATAGSANVTIDDRGTVDVSDDLIGVLNCSPWYPLNIQTDIGDSLKFDGVVRYKIVGFVVSWVEKTPLMGRDKAFSMRTASYICEH